MPHLTVTCPYCYSPVDTNLGLFAHYVLVHHPMSLAAYFQRHPRARKRPDPEELAECPGSELVLHESDRRFRPIDDPTP